MTRASVDFDVRALRARVDGLDRQVNRLVAGVLLRQEGVSEEYMRSNAPWRDRTGNARQGLHAAYGKEGDTHTLTLAHGVPYGLWLEVRYAGRYAIILQSLQLAGSQAMALLDRGLSRL